MSLLPTKPDGDGGGNIPPKPPYNYPLAIVLNNVGPSTNDSFVYGDPFFDASTLYSGTARDPLANTSTPHTEIDYFLVREGTVSYPYCFSVEKNDCMGRASYAYYDKVAPYGPNVTNYYFGWGSNYFPCLVEGEYIAKLGTAREYMDTCKNRHSIELDHIYVLDESRRRA
jgi:hypothetical protein